MLISSRVATVFRILAEWLNLSVMLAFPFPVLDQGTYEELRWAGAD